MTAQLLVVCWFLTFLDRLFSGSSTGAMKLRRNRTGQTRADWGCDGLSPGDASILGGAVEQQRLLVHVSNVENTPGRTEKF